MFNNVCVMFVSCLCNVCVMFVSCLCHVYAMRVPCLCHVYAMFIQYFGARTSQNLAHGLRPLPLAPPELDELMS